MLSQPRLGFHFPSPTATYRPDTPCVDLAYLAATNGGAFTLTNAIARVEAYAAKHPEATVVLRVDWGQNAHSYPEACDLPAWGTAWGGVKPLAHLGSRLVFQVGNEPQLEGAKSIDQVVNAWLAAARVIREACPQALIGSVPVATFNPVRYGMPAVASREHSPWADVDREIWRHLRILPERPDVDLRHVYGDGARPLNEDVCLRSEQGWRFGLNVAQTWEENRVSLGIAGMRVIVTEFNTAARGTSAPNRPADNYRAGWLPGALAYLSSALPECTDACWFIGSTGGYGDEWAAFAADGIPALRDDVRELVHA